MINISTINKALATQLEDYGPFSSLLRERNVRVGEYVNVDPNKAPWCSIYRRRTSSIPRTLKTPPSWEITYNLSVIIQAVAQDSGEKCEEILQNLEDRCLDGIVEDRTFNGTILMVNSWETEYTYIESDRMTMYFQQAMINLEVEVNVN